MVSFEIEVLKCCGQKMERPNRDLRELVGDLCRTLLSFFCPHDILYSASTSTRT